MRPLAHIVPPFPATVGPVPAYAQEPRRELLSPEQGGSAGSLVCGWGRTEAGSISSPVTLLLIGTSYKPPPNPTAACPALTGGSGLTSWSRGHQEWAARRGQVSSAGFTGPTSPRGWDSGCTSGHGGISLGREEGGPVFEHISGAPTVLNGDTLLLFYAHGGPRLPPAYHWGGTEGTSLLKVAPLGLNGGHKPAFPLGGSRREDLLGLVSSWRERVGEREEIAGHEAEVGGGGGGGSLCPKCHRLSLVVCWWVWNSQLPGKRKSPEVFADFRGVRVPTVAHLKLCVCDVTPRQVLMSQCQLSPVASSLALGSGVGLKIAER